jgi:hypothetical protein
MSEKPQQPKKPQRNSRAKKLKLDLKKRWQDIVRDVDKKEVPVDVLQRIVVKLVDGTDLSIDIKQLIDDGQDPTEIEQLLDAKFHDLDEYIENVDFFIDIDKVVGAVQPETDKVLKDL